MRATATRLSVIGILSILLASSLPVSLAEGPPPPFPPYHTVPLNHIMWPRLATPAFLRYGDTFTIFIARTADMPTDITWTAYLTSIFAVGNPYRLQPESGGLVSYQRPASGQPAGHWWVTLRVPEGIPPGLYNLTVEGGGYTFVEPNSVFIFGSDYPENFTAIHITDTHFGSRPHFPKHMKNTVLFRQIIATINGLRPDLVLHTGDLIDAIAKLEEETSFYDCYRELLRLRVPLIAVEGNNDYTAIEKGAYFWEKYFGPLYGVVQVGDFLFVLLDSDTGKVYPDQLDWLEETIQNYDRIPKILMTHYPYHSEALGYYDKDLGKSVDVTPRIREILQNYGFILALSGHWHRDDIRTPPDVPVLSITTDAVDFFNFDDYGDFRVLRIYRDHVEYAETDSLMNLNVTYLQDYGGSSTGVAIIASNGKNEPVTLRLPVILSRFAENPIIENARIIKAAEGPGGRGVYELEVELAPRETKLIKIAVEEDTAPPEISVETEVKGAKVTIWPTVSDVGLGVLGMNVYMSTDNETWQIWEPTYEVGYPIFTTETTAPKLFFKIEASDAAGNTATKYGVVFIRGETVTPPATRAPLAASMLIWIAGIVIVAIAVLAVVRRRS